ncbi:MAG: DMT family transporter [Pseudomonadota bacterium]
MKSSRSGYALGFAGGVLISVDIPLIRLAETHAFTAISARALAIAIVFLLIYLTLKKRMGWTQNPLRNPRLVMIGALIGTTNILFTGSIFYTSTANLVFILAFNPMAAALLSWIMLGERPSVATWTAIFATIGGVFIIVQDGLGQGTWIGDLMALSCALILALTLTLIRQSKQDMFFAPGFGGLMVFLFSIPLALYLPAPAAPRWLAIDAILFVPLAAMCFAIAPKLIPAPHVALFYLVETVLAPIWVWIVFTEVPTTATLIGGTIILIALTAHSVFEIRQISNRKNESGAERLAVAS